MHLRSVSEAAKTPPTRRDGSVDSREGKGLADEVKQPEETKAKPGQPVNSDEVVDWTPRYGQSNQLLCNAKKNTCKKWANKGSSKCNSHGGGSPRGIASPHFKHGAFSRHIKILPERMRADFTASMKDRNQLALNPEIALIDARIADVAKRVDSGEGGTIWERLENAWSQFESAMTAQDMESIKTQMRVLQILVRKGGEDWEVWKSVTDLIEQRRKLVESESKRMKDQAETMTATEAYVLFNAILTLVNEHVTDKETKAKLQRGFENLVNSSAPKRRQLTA